MIALAAIFVLAVCLVTAVIAGALLVAAALLLGLHAGVRVRQGLEPTALLPMFRGFLEKYVQGREAAWGAAQNTPAAPAAPAAAKPPAKDKPAHGAAPASPTDPKPQVRL